MALESESRFRVRYAETDQMAVVYYANYFVWMEVGRTDFCRACGFSYHDLEQSAGVYIAVADASCRYITSARYDDMIIVRTRLEKLNRRMMTFSYAILKEDGTRLAEGRTVHITLGPDGRPRTIPPKYLEPLERSME